MKRYRSISRWRRPVVLVTAVAALSGSATLLSPALAQAAGPLTSGILLVSTSVWTQDASITSGTTQLPPGCGSAAAPCTTAVAPGTYPLVFNTDGIDSSFGVTQPIVLDEINPTNDAKITS